MTNVYDELNNNNLDQANGDVEFMNSSANQIPDSLAIRARARKREDEQRRIHMGLAHFDEMEFKRLMALWSFTIPTNVAHDVDGIRLETLGGDTVHIRKDKITVSRSAGDETLKALVLHAKHNWNNGLKPLFEGNEELKARVWAHCQVHGVNYGWQPTPEVAAKMQLMIDRLRAEEGQRAPAPLNSEVAGVSDIATPPPQPQQSEKYQPPRNAVADLFANATPEMQKAMREPLEEIRQQNPIGDWPSEPYHYGMGRIMAYEMWLARLSEEDLKKEQAAARTRYEAHYDREAGQLTAKMKELGYNIDAPRPGRRDPSLTQEGNAASTTCEMGEDIRPGDVPTLAGESKATMRGRVQAQDDLSDLFGGKRPSRPAPELSNGGKTINRTGPSLGGYSR